MSTSRIEEIGASVEDIKMRLRFIERRAMSDNIKPHEALRLIMTVMEEFDPNSDGSWPLRSIRDIILDLMRALSARYAPTMSLEERGKVCEVILFEAMKRTAMNAENDDSWGKYNYIIQLCEKIELEQLQTGFFNDTRLFREGTLRYEKVLEPGYNSCEAYGWLRQHGSRETRFELQTVVMENAEHVYEAVANLKAEWRQNRFGAPVIVQATVLSSPQP